MPNEDIFKVASWISPNFFTDNPVEGSSTEDNFLTKPKLLQQADDDDMLHGLGADVEVQGLIRRLFQGLRGFGFGDGFAQTPSFISTPSAGRPGISLPSRPELPDRTPADIATGARAGSAISNLAGQQTVGQALSAIGSAASIPVIIGSDLSNAEKILLTSLTTGQLVTNPIVQKTISEVTPEEVKTFVSKGINEPISAAFSKVVDFVFPGQAAAQLIKEPPLPDIKSGFFTGDPILDRLREEIFNSGEVIFPSAESGASGFGTSIMPPPETGLEQFGNMGIEGVGAGAKLLEGTMNTEFLNAIPDTSILSEVLPFVGPALAATSIGLGLANDTANPATIASSLLAAFVHPVFAFPALIASIEASDFFGLGGRADMIKRQIREGQLRQHAQRDIFSGLSDALTPGVGLDIPGIDIDRENISKLSTETLLASLTRAGELRGSANASFGRAGDLPASVDRMNAEVFRRQIDLYDELQKRGITAPPEVTSWGPTTPNRFMYPGEGPYSEQDWTLAQFLNMYVGGTNAANALGYIDIKPKSGPLGSWFDQAIENLLGGDLRPRQVKPFEEIPYVGDPYGGVGF